MSRLGDDRVVRLTVLMGPSVAAALKSVAVSQQVTVTETVRRAVAFWRLVVTETRRGKRLVIVEGEGERARFREIVLKD